MTRSEFESQEMRKLVHFLKKAAKETDSDLWLAIADQLDKSKRSRRAINLNRINRFSKDGETVVVPGKVLGVGALDHPITIGALSFSIEAARKILESGGRYHTLRELFVMKQKDSDIRIIG
jgi:large subunit ribosomal protein L18e